MPLSCRRLSTLSTDRLLVCPPNLIDMNLTSLFGYDDPRRIPMLFTLFHASGDFILFLEERLHFTLPS